MITTQNGITHEWWIPRTIAIKERDAKQKIIEQVVLYLKSSTEEFTYDETTTNLTRMTQLDFEFDISDLTEFTEWSNLTETQVLSWCGVSESSITGDAKTLMDRHEKELLSERDLLLDPRDYTTPPWEVERFSNQ